MRFLRWSACAIVALALAFRTDAQATVSPKRFVIVHGGKDGMLVPPGARAELPIPKDVPHPLKTFTDTLALVSPVARTLPGTYILTIDKGAREDGFTRFAKRAEARRFRVHTMRDTDHVPERSAPAALVALLAAID